MRTATRPRPTLSRRRRGSDALAIRLLNLLKVLRAEYRRALDADQRYEALRHMNTRKPRTSADVPRRLFLEMYLSQSRDGEEAAQMDLSH